MVTLLLFGDISGSGEGGASARWGPFDGVAGGGPFDGDAGDDADADAGEVHEHDACDPADATDAHQEPVAQPA